MNIVCRPDKNGESPVSSMIRQRQKCPLAPGSLNTDNNPENLTHFSSVTDEEGSLPCFCHDEYNTRNDFSILHKKTIDHNIPIVSSQPWVACDSIPTMHKHNVNYSHGLHSKRDLSLYLHTQEREKRDQQKERRCSKCNNAVIEPSRHAPSDSFSPQVNYLQRDN